jgi:zinc/manganese transport system substrate-binding protein
MVRMLFRSAVLFGLVTLLGGLSGVAQATVQVFACEPEWAALAKELGGDRLEVYSATTASQDPHRIQARPSLIAKVRKADLLICTGAELEIGWLPLLLRRSGNARIQVGQPGHFLASGYVDMLEVPEKLDRSLGDLHASGNPHIHTDPRNILLVAGHLSQRLQQLDPENSDGYQLRYREFKSKWQDALRGWDERAAPVKGAKVVVHHDFWSYLLAWLHVDKLATLEPVPGVSPSTSHLAAVRQTLNRNQGLMIINTGYMSDRPVDWLAEQTGLPVITLPASVDYHGGETLYQWFDRLVDMLTGPVK